MLESELSDAVEKGNLEAIRSLLNAGADIHYVRPKGYSVMIDVMHGRSTSVDEQLMSVLQLLIDRGANLDGVSDYGESALSVASNMGRFDAVGLLLNAGADPAPLGWTPLMRAVALGSAEDVRSSIEKGADLTARDRWDRTAWLLSLQTGDVAKAEALLNAGAERSDRGRCGKTPLMYPIGNGHSRMLLWLLTHGIDPNETDDFGGTALIEAAESGAMDCVRILLDSGANVHYCNHIHSAIQAAANLAVVRMLVEAGADLNDINGEMRAALTRLPHDGSVTCSEAEYRSAKNRVFGSANPEQMNFPFWKSMVSGGANAYRARVQFEDEYGGGAIWCFDRFGKSINELPDGRIIEIAGEHEDFYDQDFCIYNDVIVHHGDGNFDIYGYPEAVFPPTDFHTATLVGNSIYIIGSLGYQEKQGLTTSFFTFSVGPFVTKAFEMPGWINRLKAKLVNSIRGLGYQGKRGFDTTPVYLLDINTLSIRPVETSGDSPGWISRHKAKLIDNRIELTGGKVCGFASDEELYEDNSNTYVLDLATMVWSSVVERSDPRLM
jgi:ankyrin repeat protein